MGKSAIKVHYVHNLAVKKDDPPVGDKDINAIGAVLSQHLVFKVLHPENFFTLCSWVRSSQGVQQGALTHVLSLHSKI